MEGVGEIGELEQLVPSDADGETDEYNANESKLVSPIRSAKMSSSGATSRSSTSRHCNNVGLNTSSEPKLFYLNEKKSNKDKDYNKAKSVRPRNPHKESGSNSTARHHCFLSEVPDVRHMEKALLGLLDDFHSGKLKAFGSGSTMEQMMNIREQQEKLAKLHFDLGASNDPSLSEDALRHSQSTMSQLIERLEQLSVSIEGLHSNNDK